MATTKKHDARRRPERVASRIQRELASILRQELGDPRLADVVVSGVVVTDDISQTTVSFVVAGEGADGARTRQAARVLKALEGAVRAKLAPRLGLRRMPTVHFVVDTGREEAERLDALLHEVSQEIKKEG